MERPHYKLKAWQEAMELVKAVYDVSGLFPREEAYGLTSQLRRSAVSVPSNLAGGAARRSNKEFLQFLNIASGFLSELETQLLIAVELNYMERGADVFSILDKVSRLINGLKKHINNKVLSKHDN